MVKGKEFVDPILTFQLANDLHVRRIFIGYLPSFLTSGHTGGLQDGDLLLVFELDSGKVGILICYREYRHAIFSSSSFNSLRFCIAA
jgi:hypothetical protein